MQSLFRFYAGLISAGHLGSAKPRWTQPHQRDNLGRHVTLACSGLFHRLPGQLTSAYPAFSRKRPRQRNNEGCGRVDHTHRDIHQVAEKMVNSSRTRRSVTEPLLRQVSPTPIEDDADNPRDSEEWCTHLGERIQRSASLPSKIAATLLSFVVLGLIISTPGVILPRLEDHYHLDDAKASLIFLVAPVGYLVGAWLNDRIHRRLGQRGIAVIAPVFQAVFTVLIGTVHDPHRGGFPVFLVATSIGNIGNGLIDGSWCAWAGGLGGQRTNTVQGLLHGSFSIGAGLGPFLAETMFSVGKTPWWTWYYVLLGAIFAEAVALCLAFRFEDADRYRADLERSRTGPYGGAEGRRPEMHARTMFKYAATWICAAYFLVYVGTESAISGWVITFMLRVRHATPYLASFSSSGFWTGMAVGRLVLGLVTDKLGVRRATAAYLTIAIILQALLATIDVAAVSIALVALIGFFLGPMFPSGVVLLAQLLPKQLLVGAVSFTAAVGQIGAAVSPFILGSLAQALGIYIFQVFILAMLAVTLLVWVLFPALPSARPDRP